MIMIIVKFSRWCFCDPKENMKKLFPTVIEKSEEEKLIADEFRNDVRWKVKQTKQNMSLLRKMWAFFCINVHQKQKNTQQPNRHLLTNYFWLFDQQTRNLYFAHTQKK